MVPLTFFLVIALVNLCTAHRFERAARPRALPLVSVLVPARNEADNLAANLPSLLLLDYPNLEILVLDDRSEDDTRIVAEQIARTSGGRLKVLAGGSLPTGWIGKSWACHQLASVASGDILVFCDADVRAARGAVRLTVGLLEAHRAGAATVLPLQIFGGWVERAVIPLIVHLPMLTLLPLRLVSRRPEPSLSIATGQWLAFTRATYVACGGHFAVRASVVEDLQLGRRVKAAGHRLVPAVASSELSVRMYRDNQSLRQGFQKNLYALLGGRPTGLVLGVLVFFATAVFPLAAPFLWGWAGALPLALLAAVRACGAVLFRDGWRSSALHPIGSLLVIWLAMDSFLATRRATLTWKGRPLPVNTPGVPAVANGKRQVV